MHPILTRADKPVHGLVYQCERSLRLPISSVTPCVSGVNDDGDGEKRPQPPLRRLIAFYYHT